MRSHSCIVKVVAAGAAASATVIALPFLCTAVSNAATQDPGQWIENQEYRFRLHVPLGLAVCTESSGGHPHGFSILLHADTLNCMSRAAQPYMAVFGDYNVLFSPNPSQSLQLLCPHNLITEAASSDLHLAFTAHASAVCRKKDKDGWIDIFVATQGGKWPDDGSEETGPFINYTAWLHSSPAELDKNLEMFRRFLSAVQFTER